MSGVLEAIIAEGDRGPNHERINPNWITCVDGFRLSVIAGMGCYCAPRPDWPFEDGAAEDYAGPYTHVEVGFPSERPQPWDDWAEWCESPDDPTGTVYARVPVDAVRALVVSHGGEADVPPASGTLGWARKATEVSAALVGKIVEAQP